MCELFCNFVSKILERLNMSEKISKISTPVWVMVAFGICALVLIVTGLLFPPPGEIHNSVLIALGELFGFALLIPLMIAIERGIGTEVTHGNTTIRIESKSTDND